jgi:hypothetical protein
MNAAQKKAFALRMKAARAAKARATKAPKKATKKATKKTARRVPTSPKRAGRVTSKKKAGRRNPDEAAAMYERFHGRGPGRTIEYSEELQYRDNLAELGKLLELRFRLDGVREPVPLFEFGPCQVTCTPDGTNIYFVGGRQAVDLAQIGIDSDKDYVELGECTYVKYLTKKGFHAFEPVEYWHKFGEEDGVRPVLAYDTVNRALFLVGGNYQCKPEGIVN